MNSKTQHESYLLQGLVLSCLIALLYVTAAMHFPVDYPAHAGLGESLLKGTGELPPHFLWHALLILIHKVTGGDFMVASFIGVFICVFAASFGAYRTLDREVSTRGSLIVMATICAFFVHPILLIYPHDGYLFLGYVSPNPYHNPTLILLKPLALLHFVIFCLVLRDIKVSGHGVATYLILAISFMLSAVAKPSYVVMFLPGLGLAALVSMVFGKRVEVSRNLILLLGTLVPGLAVLLWQYVYFFVESARNASIGIEFLGLYSIYSESWTFPFKLLGSVAFPVSLVFVMGKRLVREPDFQLSAAMLIVSLIYFYFLVEIYNGKVSPDGNWGWSALLANFLFFFTCIKYYLREVACTRWRRLSGNNLQLLMPGLFLILHLLSGVIWFASHLFPGAVHPFIHNFLF